MFPRDEKTVSQIIQRRPFVTCRQAGRLWIGNAKKLQSRKFVYFNKEATCCLCLRSESFFDVKRSRNALDWLDSASQQITVWKLAIKRLLRKNTVKFSRYLCTHTIIALTLAHFDCGSHKMWTSRFLLVFAGISLIDLYRCQKINSHLRVASFYVSVCACLYSNLLEW